MEKEGTLEQTLAEAEADQEKPIPAISQHPVQAVQALS